MNVHTSQGFYNGGRNTRFKINLAIDISRIPSPLNRRIWHSRGYAEAWRVQRILNTPPSQHIQQDLKVTCSKISLGIKDVGFWPPCGCIKPPITPKLMNNSSPLVANDGMMV